MNRIYIDAAVFGAKQARRRFTQPLAVMIFLTGASAFGAPEDAATTYTATESTTATEARIFAQDNQPLQSIFLIGEVVSLDEESPVKGPFPLLLDLTTSTLGGTVADYTSQGLTIAQTAAMVASAKASPPDVTVLFAGYSDEQQEVDDEEQRASLQAIVKSLRARNPAMRIFLVPAATTVGALTSANLRLVATDTNATFIPLGTEISGEPYKEALAAIKVELQAAPETVADQPEAPAPSNAVSVQGKNLEAPAPDAAASDEYEKQKATLQQELDRIAGESGDVQSLPSLADTTATDFATTAAPAGGTMTKRGAEAREAINMRPLPAVKAFRPQIPVPRNNIDVKEPALSRQ